MKNMKNWASDDLPREKFILKGASSISHAELLAILIGSGTQKKSALQLSRELFVMADNNLNILSRKSIEELQKLQGIGKAKAVAIAAAFELGRRREMAEAEKNIIKRY
jgi:DNA repair protein RadC